jgi:ubiquinone/menaquinone biosynthesis C-methylase UbiE
MHSIVNTHQAAAWNGWEGRHWAQHADRYNAMNGGFNAALFAAAAIGERDRVLDIGCGVGQTTRLAARHAARGHAYGIDLSTPMLERARRTAADEGITNVTFEQGDAQVHPFPKGAFDVAISRGGVMFFTDLVAAFANIGRALRPGGRLAFFGPQRASPDGDYARATASLSSLLRAPSPASRGMMSLADPARIYEVLADAGFLDVIVNSTKAPMIFGQDAADAADFILSIGPVRFNLDGIDPTAVDRIRDELRAGLLPYQTADGVRIPGAVWMVTATHP